MVERNSHESGLKCDLLQDYRTIFPPPQAFATGLAAFAASRAGLFKAAGVLKGATRRP